MASDVFEAVGRDTALKLAPADGRVFMTVLHRGAAGGHSSVILERAYLRPLAAWFAGEAVPVALGDRPGTLYGLHLSVSSDEAAVVWCTHTWARLSCASPFGTARVVIGPRGRSLGSAATIPPGARLKAAEWLRHTDAQGWARPAATA